MPFHPTVMTIQQSVSAYQRAPIGDSARQLSTVQIAARHAWLKATGTYIKVWYPDYAGGAKGNKFSASGLARVGDSVHYIDIEAFETLSEEIDSGTDYQVIFYVKEAVDNQAMIDNFDQQSAIHFGMI